eukprot:CAMPEP_0113443690 /NCGR_PEP_ID=MMETSP0014_2-20120614/2274_1 /TAXON_ID=2857 /ORGANISM="Nitzschia sp." /LENGTH=375 /DNA_ID=CAMNT_0000334665 /DNA_START=296 /DNA_END=1423 /DNA_ORIENTATION=+ /assembly_acc=CAM_ASM_000159
MISNTTKVTTALLLAATATLLFAFVASFSSASGVVSASGIVAATEAVVAGEDLSGQQQQQQQQRLLRGGRRRRPRHHHHHRGRRTDDDDNEFTEINFTYTYRENTTTNAASPTPERQFDVVCLVPNKCHHQTQQRPEDSEEPAAAKEECPLYVWIDGTDAGIFDGRPAGTDDLDRTFLQEMASRGYVACNPHYDDTLIGYIDGCGGATDGDDDDDDDDGLSGSGFVGRSRAIFDPTLPDSVVSQVCGTYAVCDNSSPTQQNHSNSNNNNSNNNQNKIVVHGFSQGAHIAQLASYWNSNISKALLFGNGNVATILGGVADIELPCMMDPTYNRLDRTLRRYITGENDIIFSPYVHSTVQIIVSLVTSFIECVVLCE